MIGLSDALAIEVGIKSGVWGRNYAGGASRQFQNHREPPMSPRGCPCDYVGSTGIPHIADDLWRHPTRRP
jgi:hypothetical protein